MLRSIVLVTYTLRVRSLIRLILLLMVLVIAIPRAHTLLKVLFLSLTAMAVMVGATASAVRVSRMERVLPLAKVMKY